MAATSLFKIQVSKSPEIVSFLFFPFDNVAHIVRKRDGHSLTAAGLESYRVKNVGTNPEAQVWSEGEKKTLLWNLVRREPLQEKKNKKKTHEGDVSESWNGVFRDRVFTITV